MTARYFSYLKASRNITQPSSNYFCLYLYVHIYINCSYSTPGRTSSPWRQHHKMMHYVYSVLLVLSFFFLLNIYHHEWQIFANYHKNAKQRNSVAYLPISFFFLFFILLFICQFRLLMSIKQSALFRFMWNFCWMMFQSKYWCNENRLTITKFGFLV